MNPQSARIKQDLMRPKVARLLTPKKARRTFNKQINNLAKEAYVKILKRRILIWIIIALGSNIISNVIWYLVKK